MKKLIAVFLITVCAGVSSAQSFRNEWIDYTKTYYKFKVVSNGLYRITQSQLSTLGIGSANAQDFKMYCNGTEVPIYVSSTTGPLASNGYIEFYGKKNDGNPDTDLYPDPTYQPSTVKSLFSDTAIYFLAVRPGTNARSTDVSYSLTNPGTPAAYCLYDAEQVFADQLWGGNASYISGEYVRSATFDKGEGFQSDAFNTTQVGFSNLKAYTAGGGTMMLYTKGAGAFIGGRPVYCKMNDSLLSNTYNSSFDVFESSVSSIPLSRISSDATTLTYYTSGTSVYETITLSYIKLSYPRQFDFGGNSQFAFRLPANASGAYLEINNFNHSGVAPVLYDLTTNQRYTCQLSGNTVRVKLQASTSEHSFVLLNSSNVNYLTGTAKTFVNYGLAANQGTYLIISNSILNSGSNNQVQAYSNYRASTAGGSFNTKMVDVSEITDQFAYGITLHSIGIRNFLRYARASFATAPKFVLLIGHGINYRDYYLNSDISTRSQLNLVPTWGDPGSDNLLSAATTTDPNIGTPIGRISATNNTEVQGYLAKVVEFEQQQANTTRTQAAQDWKKQVLHLIGASDAQTGDLIQPMMDAYTKIIKDTFTGAEVHSYIKANNPNITQSTAEVAGLIDNGVALLTYFGHSSATSLDFNLNNPSDYTNSNGRYPVFIANGCNAGNFFAFDESRLAGANYTISEKFLLAPSRGSIAFIASTHFGVLNTLDYITNSWYTAASKTNYGQSLGEIQKEAVRATWQAYNGDYHTRLTLEETTINGDPALKVFAQMLPDYAIEPSDVVVTPSFISTADDSFHIKVVPYNLGKAIGDSVTIKIERKTPDGNTRQTFVKRLRGIRHTDTVELNIPIIGNLEKGTNQIVVTLDPQGAIAELSETNNTATASFTISSDEIRPVYPYNFSIVNTNAFKLAGSTIDPLEPSRTYRMQMDTTELFNSGMLTTADKASAGGVVEFSPATMTNGLVYYWRLAPVVNGVAVNWRTASFLYNSGGTPGWNQSHLYQHLKSTYTQLSLDSMTRTYQYGNRINNLFITQSKYPESGTEDGHFSISVNGDLKIASACVGNSIIFNLFDTVTFQPLKNSTALYGSYPNCNTTNRSYNFEFEYTSPAKRKVIMDFMDTIPVGYYVAARNILADIPSSLASVWQADTAIYGSGKSLYHYLNAQGAVMDSINNPGGRIWAFVYRKNSQARFTPKFFFSQGLYDRITASVDCPTIDTLGYVTSPNFGPARSWQNVHWHGHSVETSNSPDSTLLTVIGVDNAGMETALLTLNSSQLDYGISTISAATYPYLRLKLRNQDAVHASPWQLDYWRIDYTPVPEGALAANLYYTGAATAPIDSVQVSKYPFGIAFKNVSNIAFDSVKVKVQLTDSLGNTRNIAIPKLKAIIAGDTARVYFELNTDTLLAGTYNMLVDINPDNSQLEQYHFNNFIYKTISIQRADDLGICPGSSITYKAGITGSGYQWQVNTGSGYVDITENAVYSGTGTSTLKLTAPPTSWYGYKYRCIATGTGNSTEKTLKFSVKWYGTADTKWENAANWSCGVIPDEFTDVILNSSLSRYPVVNSAAACRSLKALPNTTLRVITGNSLKIAGKSSN